KIQPAIAIVVKESRTAVELRARSDARDSGLFGHIGECAVSVVVIKDVLPELRDVKVGKVVVVVVAPDAAQAVSCPRDTSSFGDVGERAVAIVVVEGIVGGQAPAVKIAAIYKVNVLPPVAVEICDTKAGTEDLADDGDALVARIMDELDTCLGGYVCE